MTGRPTEDWPAEDLERVAACPVCQCPRRAPLYKALADRAFRVAPGKWDVWRCLGCGSSYLDPRPTEGSIGRAYASYYTHVEPPPSAFEVPSAGRKAKLRAALRNGYLNRRFGHRLKPASDLAALVALAPAVMRGAEAYVRHLPRPQPGDRLLDVGCGNGQFLRVARVLGYEAEGLEVDAAAAAIGRRAGLIVRTVQLRRLGREDGRFAVVTLNHVIEHVHSPRAVLCAVFRLLRPGGCVWIQTPNIESSGSQYWGPDWFHLAPPNHLAVFTWRGLRLCLEEAGFVNCRLLPPEPDRGFVRALSAATRRGDAPFASGAPPLPALGWFDQILASLQDLFGPRSQAETLTAVGLKPPDA